ncbi:MAG: hypothetical protein ACR2K9_06320 [Solirubrobacteraceae bacterium]
MTITRRISPDGWAVLAIAAGVILANLPYLLGILDPNPLGPRSGLASETTPGFLGGFNTIDPNNGFLSQAVSHRAAIDLVHLRMPWWNPYEGTGTPLAGGMQSAALFPLTLLTLLSNGQIYEHILLEMIAGISTYLLLRRLCVIRWAAAAAGLAFALNGTFAWLAHATVNPVAFLPLLLLGIEIAYAASVEKRRGGWWLIAVAGALSFYAGFPEVAYINTLMAAGWFVWRCGCLDRSHWRALLSKAAAGAAAGTLLAAPLIIAFVSFVGHSYLGAHTNATLGHQHFPPLALPQVLMPYVYGPIFRFGDPKGYLPGLWGSVGGYLSTSLLLFGLLGILSRGRRGLKMMLLVWIALVAGRMYGVPVLGGVLGVLPGMQKIAFFRYATSSLELSVIILAALGLSSMATRPEPRRRLAAATLASVVAVGLAALGARTLTSKLGPDFAERHYYAGALVWGLLVLLAAVVAALIRSSRARALLIALVLAGDAMALFVVPELSAPRRVRTDLAPVAFLQRNLGQSRFFTLGPLQPNYGSYFGIASLNANDVPAAPFADYVRKRLDRYVDPTTFVGNSGGGRSPLLPSPQQELVRNLDGYRNAGVAFVLTPPGQALPESPKTFKLVMRSSTTRIYRLAGAAPYFTSGTPGCATTPESRMSVRLTCSRPGVLVRRETYLPGWRAEVDGDPVPLGSSEGIFQSVAVGKGSHRVAFSYRPPYVVWGYLALALGFGWLLGAAVLRRRRRATATSRPAS